MITQQSKADLRREAAAARAALVRDVGDIGDRLAASFAAAIALKPCHAIAGYFPFRDEADPRPLMRFLAAGGWTCALPVTTGGPEGLVFREWRPDEPVAAGRYGIPVPRETAPAVRPDIVLVPLLAYDGAGRRLGYGAGYYDRALASLRRAGAVLAVGLAYDGQRMTQVPTEDHDERLDMIVTELGATDFRKAAS